jgi:hypothetical protein
MTRFAELLRILCEGGVEFVVIGGLALTLRGGSRATFDIDVCYGRSDENLERLARALAEHRPRLRGAPDDLPFLWDARTLRSGLNFTLKTDLGDIDLLGEVLGVGGYVEALQASSSMSIYGLDVRVLDLDGLARAKRAAGRVKDLVDLAEIAELKKR